MTGCVRVACAQATVHDFLAEMTEHLKANAPHQLVALGTEGYFLDSYEGWNPGAAGGHGSLLEAQPCIRGVEPGCRWGGRRVPAADPLPAPATRPALPSVIPRKPPPGCAACVLLTIETAEEKCHIAPPPLLARSAPLPPAQ
jgi:hypothetical protein